MYIGNLGFAKSDIVDVALLNSTNSTNMKDLFDICSAEQLPPFSQEFRCTLMLPPPPKILHPPGNKLIIAVFNRWNMEN